MAFDTTYMRTGCSCGSLAQFDHLIYGFYALFLLPRWLSISSIINDFGEARNKAQYMVLQKCA
jgi:hypothetical protein